MFKRFIGKGTTKAFWKRLWFTVGKPASAGLLVLILVSYLWGEGGLFSLQRLFSFRPTLTGALNNALLVKVLLTITIGIAAFMYLGKMYGEHLRKLPLFAAIVAWVLLSLIAFTTVGWLWSKGGQPYLSWGRFFTIWRPESAPSNPEEFLPAALAIVGGIGAVGYLVIKYRERSGEERTEAEELIQKAVEQLGSESDQVRIAGVYALTNIADTYRGQYKQRVVDILCGYLRTKRGKFVERKPEKTLIEDADVNTTGTDATSVYESDDGPVESTILEVFASHLRKQDAADTKASTTETIRSWSECKFDLHGACFIEPLSFKSRIFIGDITFKECHFAREVNFIGSTFEGGASFEASTFTDRAIFHDSTFKGPASFLDSTFNDRASFHDSTFNDRASFHDSTFNDRASFDDSTFNGFASFDGSTFTGEASFDGSTFKGMAIFHFSTFKGRASFDRSTFDKWASFNGSTFESGIAFDGSTFNDWANFDDSTFTGEASFDRSTFNRRATFDGSTFEGEASFNRSTFNGLASFDRSTFNRKTQDAYKALFRCSPFGQPPLEDNGLPKGARWDDDPMRSDDDTAPEGSPPDGDTALPDEH